MKGNTGVAAQPIVVDSTPVGSNALLAAMKEELFVLETDKLQGRLSETEYQAQKSALETVLRRALVREEQSTDTSKVS
jgi:hypothetical protein